MRQSPGPKQGRAAAGAQQARGHSAGAGLALVVQNSVFRGNAVVRKLVINMLDTDTLAGCHHLFCAGLLFPSSEQ